MVIDDLHSTFLLSSFIVIDFLIGGGFKAFSNSSRGCGELELSLSSGPSINAKLCFSKNWDCSEKAYSKSPRASSDEQDSAPEGFLRGSFGYYLASSNGEAN